MFFWWFRIKLIISKSIKFIFHYKKKLLSGLKKNEYRIFERKVTIFTRRAPQYIIYKLLILDLYIELFSIYDDILKQIVKEKEESVIIIISINKIIFYFKNYINGKLIKWIAFA